MNEWLEIIAAAAGKNPTVRGVAYSGGKMRLWGWAHPVVVDLSGMSVPESVPLLANHENHTLGRVGVVAAKASDGRLEIEGGIVAESDLAAQIVAQGKAGADWQLSIGAEVEAAELVQSGKRTVNGAEHDAPFYHVTRSTLREVSVVAVGADRSTHMKVTASLKLKGETEMNRNRTDGGGEPQIQAVADGTPAAQPAETTPPAQPATVAATQPVTQTAQQPATVDVEAVAQAAVKAERERVGMVKAVCGGEFPEIEAQAIAEGWDKNKVNEAVLAAFRAKQPAAPQIAIKKEASCITVGLFDTDSGVKRCEHGARSAECLQRAA